MGPNSDGPHRQFRAKFQGGIRQQTRRAGLFSLSSHSLQRLGTGLTTPTDNQRCATMAGVKRRRDGAKAHDTADSPYIPMFETFRLELDEHHDRRERIIKASRDITASSKKM